jgi:hypothetical protein
MLQAWVWPHLIPQPPQLFGSLLVLTHIVPQSVSPPWQGLVLWQTPLMQTAAPQERPHWPQLSLLESRFTQPPSHSVVPCGQLVLHVPMAHTSPGPQVLPQPPQFCVLEARLTHWPEHFTVPWGQVHWPPLHTVPPVQVTSQPPQFSESV